MAFRLVGGFPDSYTLEGTVTAGTAIAEGDMLALSGNVLARASASSTIHSVFGVAAETISTAATTIKYIPLIDGQLWEWDTFANTDSTELYEGQILKTYATVDNTDTTVTGPTAVCTPIALVGATGDKKCLGFIHHLHPTST